MTRPLKTKLADIKRRAILDAAMQEFESKGPDKASLRAIASTAGMTTGAIYSMFGGKDDLYAALLLESLERLESHVAQQVAQATNPKEALRASVMGFFVYYDTRPFEVQLGMYSFSGLRHASLGPDRDETLNNALMATLDIIADTISQAAPNLPPETVIAERNAIVSSLFGALTLSHTGRAISIGTTADAVMQTHVTSLLERLQNS